MAATLTLDSTLNANAASAVPAAQTSLPRGLRSLLSWYEPWRVSRGGLALVIAAHLLLLWILLQTRGAPLPELVDQAPVLSVSLISPQVQVAPPEVVPTPPPPKVIEPPRPKPPQKQLVSTAPPQPTAPQVEAPPAEPPVTAEPVIAPAPAPAPVAQASAAAAPAPQPPRFDAAYLDNPSPVYPRLSRRMGEQGKTLLMVQVSAEGKALQVELHQSSGSPRLDQAAIEAVRRWRFVPARQGEQKVAASVIVPIVFSLQN